jgi:hypothetical protein
MFLDESFNYLIFNIIYGINNHNSARLSDRLCQEKFPQGQQFSDLKLGIRPIRAGLRTA